MKTVETLGPELKAALRDAEERIQGAFAVQGRALREIRDQELYRADNYESFLAYCEGRWEWTREHAYRLIDAADVYDALSPIGDKVPPPENEAQARELAPLMKHKGVEAMAETWRLLREEHGPAVTAAHVRQAATVKLNGSRAAKLTEPQAPPPKEPPVAKAPPEPPTLRCLRTLRDDVASTASKLGGKRVKVYVDVEAVKALDEAIAALRERA